MRNQQETYPQLRTLWARGLAWGFSHLTFDGDRVTVRMIEVPEDGSMARVSYEQSFAHRSRD